MAQRTVPTAETLTRGGLLARNTVWNLVGQCLPTLLALVAIPLLVARLGTERFGVLALAWLVIGYSNVFDLGMGRALTKLVAERLGAGEDAAPLVWTALPLMLITGAVGTVVVVVLAPWLASDVLKVPVGLQDETVQTFFSLAISIPLVIGTAGLRGVVEAHQRFDLANVVGMAVAVLNYLGPILATAFGGGLRPVVATLVVGRIAALIAYALLCWWIIPGLRARPSLDGGAVRPLLRLGGWMTLSSYVFPLMVLGDRFLIGALVSVTAVAYYSTPYEAVTRFWLIPAAVSGVLYPAFATGLTHDRARALRLFRQGMTYVFVLMFPLTLVVVVGAGEGLRLWLGPAFAAESSRVLQFLAIGVGISSMSNVPFALIQAAGRPDLTAKLHLAELPFYILGSWWMIRRDGIEGAAVTWAVRCAVDTFVLLVIAGSLAKLDAAYVRRVWVVGGGALLTLLVATIPSEPMVKAAFLALVLPAFGGLVWVRVFGRDERSAIALCLGQRRALSCLRGRA